MLCVAQTLLTAQNAQISISSGMSYINSVNEVSIGVELRYLFDNNYILGVRAGSTLQVPLRIDRISAGIDETHRYEGTSTVNSLMLDLGWRESFGRFTVIGGISGGGVNVANQRLLGSINVLTGDDSFNALARETIANPAFAFGGWLTFQYRIGKTWLVGLGGTFDYSEHRRTIATNETTGAEYVAVFAGPQPRAFLSFGKDLGVPDIDDSSRYHGWLLATVTSIHPFTDRSFNQFNPGVGLHIRFEPGEFTWFAEGAVYQHSRADRALYVGGGAYYSLAGEWLKVGLLGGVLTFANATGMDVVPVLSPRLTVDTKFGSVSVLYIPDWTEAAFGLMVHLPLF